MILIMLKILLIFLHRSYIWVTGYMLLIVEPRNLCVTVWFNSIMINCLHLDCLHSFLRLSEFLSKSWHFILLFYLILHWLLFIAWVFSVYHYSPRIIKVWIKLRIFSLYSIFLILEVIFLLRINVGFFIIRLFLLVL